MYVQTYVARKHCIQVCRITVGSLRSSCPTLLYTYVLHTVLCAVAGMSEALRLQPMESSSKP